MKTTHALFLCALTIVAAMPRSPAAPADVDLSFDPGSTLDDIVSAMAVQPDGKVILGGYFTMVHGMQCTRLARFEADGAVDTSFKPMIATAVGRSWVGCVTVLSDGKLLIGGDFSSINGVTRTNLARLNPDGSLDESFLASSTGPNGQVLCAYAQTDGKLLVGGTFTALNGLARGRLARLNADGTVDNSFLNGLEGAADYPVLCLQAQADGSIYVGGSFTAFNGMARTNLVRLLPDGSIDQSFLNGLTGPSIITGFSEVQTLAVQSDAKLLISGVFTSVNGIPRSGTARLNPDGTVDNSFVADVQGFCCSVPRLALQADGKVLLAGAFTSVNGQSRGCLVRLNPSGSVDDTFSANFRTWRDVGIQCLGSLPNGKVLAAGDYLITPAGRSRFCRLNGDGTIDPSFNLGRTGPDDEVLTAVVQADGRVLIGGRFLSVSGSNRGHLARIMPDGALDGTFLAAPLAGADRDVFSLALEPDGKILVGGEFSSFNGLARPSLVRINPDGTLDNSFSNSLAGYVYSLALQSDGRIIAGGAYRENNPARLYADGSLDPTFVCNMARNTWVYSIALQPDGRVLIGGTFDTINGITRPNLARLGADGSVDNSFLTGMSGPNQWGLAGSILLQNDGKILIGSSFDHVNEVPRKGLARLNIDGSLDGSFLQGMAGPNWDCTALALDSDGNILAAGPFNSFNGVPSGTVVRLHADGSLDSSFGDGQSGPNGWVPRIIIQPDGKILIAGGFTAVNRIPRSFLARLSGSYSPPFVISEPKSQTAETGSSVRFSVKAGGSPPLAYAWFFENQGCLTAGSACTNLDLTELNGSQSGAYTVVVTNASGAVTSAPAMLNVIAPVPRRVVPGILLSAEVGRVFNIDHADSLGGTPLWLSLGEVTLTAPSQYYFDLSTELPAQRFYRARSSAAQGQPQPLDLSLIPAITLTGDPGSLLRVEGINAVGPVDAWFTLDTVTLTNSTQLYFDTSAVGQPARLYRLLPGP